MISTITADTLMLPNDVYHIVLVYAGIMLAVNAWGSFTHRADMCALAHHNESHGALLVIECCHNIVH